MATRDQEPSQTGPASAREAELCARPDLGKLLDDIHNRHHAPMATLRLAAYSCDAMRVLNNLERSAELNPALDETLRSCCASWKNPGSAHDPADLIAEAIGFALQDVGGLFSDLMRVADSAYAEKSDNL